MHGGKRRFSENQLRWMMSGFENWEGTYQVVLKPCFHINQSQSQARFYVTASILRIPRLPFCLRGFSPFSDTS